MKSQPLEKRERPNKMSVHPQILAWRWVECRGFQESPELPVTYYGKVDWEAYVEGYKPSLPYQGFNRLHPVLKALVKSLDEIVQKIPQLLSTPRPKTGIYAAGLLEAERDWLQRMVDDGHKIRPSHGPLLTHNGINFTVASFLGIPFYSGWGINHVCSSGNDLLRLALWEMEQGKVDIAILVAINSMQSTVRTAYHQVLGIVSQTGKVRSFAKDRDGTVVADGMVVMVLATPEWSAKHGIPSAAKVLSAASVADSSHMYSLDPDGEAWTTALLEAIRTAGITPEDIQVIKAHGTGTRMNDEVEGGIISRIFSRSSPVVTAIKPRVGHTISASSLLELAILIQDLTLFGKVTPINGVKEEDVDRDLASLKLATCDKEWPCNLPAKVVSLAAGFGGFYSAAVLEVEGE